MFYTVEKVEDFEEVCPSRYREMQAMRKLGHKSMRMHIGGIYIECLLKSIIIAEKNIVYAIRLKGERRLFWYNENSYKKIFLEKKPEYKSIIRNFSSVNPIHNLSAAISQIDNGHIFKSMPDEYVRYMQTVSEPISDIGYIEMRYIPEEEVKEADISKWEEHFFGFARFLNKIRRQI